MIFKRDHAVFGISGPMDYKYMKLLRFALRFISGWPGKELGEKSRPWEGIHYAYYNTLLSWIYFVSGLAYLKIHWEHLTFFGLGHMYIVLLLNSLSTSRASTLCLSLKYRALTKLYIQKIHLFYHKEKSDYAMMIHETVHRYSHIFAIIVFIVMIMALSMFTLTPVVNNYLSGKYESRENLINATYEHAIYFIFPWNSDSNFNGYLAASAINLYGTLLCSNGICMFDLFLGLMVFNIWGHFKILIHNLGSFPRPTATDQQQIDHPGRTYLYSKTEQKDVAEKLNDCIRYHLMIVHFTDKMSDAFGFALLAYLLFHQVSGCLLLLLCSQLNTQALVRYVPVTVVLFTQLIILSVIFEIIGSMSVKLRDAVYGIPWEFMDTENRKTVLIYLMNVKEIHVTAGGMANIGVMTMASIFKTSFSYFAFLRTVEH